MDTNKFSIKRDPMIMKDMKKNAHAVLLSS
jgi:hypothetical protein